MREKLRLLEEATRTRGRMKKLLVQLQQKKKTTENDTSTLLAERHYIMAF